MAPNGINPTATPDSAMKPVVESNRLTWCAGIAMVYLLTLATWIPWNGDYVHTSLTRSWQMVLKWAFIHRLDFGHKLAFTYGPWGFAITGYDPQTCYAQVAVWALLSAGFTAGVVSLARHFSPRLFIALPVMIFVVLLLGSNRYEFLDLRPLSLTWLLLVIGLFVACKPTGFATIVLVISLALASQMKFTVGIMSVGVLLLLTIHGGREIPWLAISYMAAYLFFWLLAGQHLSSLPAYLNHSLRITAAYGDIEAISTPNEFNSIMLFLLGCGSILLLLVAVNWKQWRQATVSVLALTFCLFVIFKAGFVRHDSHEIESTGCLAIISVLIAIAIWNRHRWKHQCLIAGVVLFNLGLLWRTYALFDADGLPIQLGGSVLKLFLSPKAHNDLARSDLPQVQGSVDIYPWGQDVLLTHGLDYQPRPVFQSYLAESAYLAELNAQHLRGPDAPESILFCADAIDEQFPAFSDATSWPEILSRYDLMDAAKPWLLYRHAKSAGSFSIARNHAIKGKLGQPIQLPSDDRLIWARIDLRLTRFGHINDVLYKSPQLTLLVTTADGRKKPFRFIPTIARQGFLLSPLVAEPLTFALLQSDHWQAELARLKVKSVAILCDQAEMPPCYDDEFDCSFDRLSILTRDISGVPGIKK